MVQIMPEDVEPRKWCSGEHSAPTADGGRVHRKGPAMNERTYWVGIRLHDAARHADWRRADDWRRLLARPDAEPLPELPPGRSLATEARTRVRRLLATARASWPVAPASTRR
jgi:hypothetical protein